MSRAERGGILLRLTGLLVFAAFLCLLYLARHPLLRLAGNWWVVEDALAHADAIIVLGDDNFAGDRASRAAELFQAGWAPQVVASGRMLRPYAGMAEIIERDLKSRGVPAAATIRFEHKAANTIQEAQALRDLVLQRHWHSILVVTSNYHTRRARYTFRKVFPSGVSVSMISAEDSEYLPNIWWQSRPGLKHFFTESVAYPLAMWELRRVQAAGSPAGVAVWGYGWVRAPGPPGSAF
jgi:uncharacterized SAM-binding protein YcdF (DUF218 family)